MKEWFKARNIWGAGILQMTDAEAGRFAKALWKYSMDGTETDLEGPERVFFAMARMNLDGDDEAANALSAVRAAAGAKGGMQKVANKANASFATEPEAKPEPESKKPRAKKPAADVIGFDTFWAAYPRKTNKAGALKAFQKISPDAELLARMIDAIEKQKGSAQWTEDGGRYIPHPATWLNGQRWEDELPAAGQGSGKPAIVRPVVAQGYGQRDYTDDMYTSPEAMLAALKEG